MIASLRERRSAGARPEFSLIETAGDRILFGRMLWSGGPPGGRFEIEHLALLEIDASGLITATVLFDVDDARAAKREAWARWGAIDPVAAPWLELLTELSEAWNAHDRARVRACFADDVRIEDHRHAGLGRIQGADAYVDSNVVLWDLAAHQRIEFGGFWPAVDKHAVLVSLRREGQLMEGGAFENDYLWLGVAKAGRISRLELFGIDDVEAALARFEELRPDPEPMPANAATRARC
jgi:ketosteroid isomerase-like protein